jgi:hypothetical protein
MTGSCWNGTTAFTVPALAGTLLGSFYCTTGATSPACVSMQFKPAAVVGGSNPVLGLSNAYNRIRFSSLDRDSANGWSQTTASTWEPLHNNNNNRVTALDALQQSPIDCFTQVDGWHGTGGVLAIGCNLNATTGAPTLIQAGATNSGSIVLPFAGSDTFSPQLGLFFVQAMEWGTTGVTWVNNSPGGNLAGMRVSLDL